MSGATTTSYTPDNPPTGRQLSWIIGRSETCAWRRLKKWRAGELDWAGLFARGQSPQPAARYTPDNPPNGRQLAEIIGVGESAAQKRLARWRAGELDWDGLFAESTSRILALVRQRAGLRDSAARARLRKFRSGEITEAQLYAPPRMLNEPMPKGGLLMVGARRRLADIPGPTELERRVLG